MEDAEAAVEAGIAENKTERIAEKRVAKSQKQTESMMAFEDMSLMNRANSLAFYTLLGDTNLINKELDRYQQVTTEDSREKLLLFLMKTTVIRCITMLNKSCLHNVRQINASPDKRRG